MRILRAITATGLITGASLFGPNIFAEEDEIVVTASRASDSPGIFIEKRGDFLLLDVRITNDSRESKDRLEQMTKTIDSIIAAAKENPDIVLSLIDDNDFVRPLTRQAFIDGIRPGGQPDTSYADLKVKTNIPKDVKDSYKLIRKLESFVEDINGSGRTRIIEFDQVAVSILDPYQYRDEVRKKVLGEMASTTERFGPNYVIIPQGLDGPVRWARSGDLNLAFYMRTSYKIYPKDLSIKLIASDDWGEFEDF